MAVAVQICALLLVLSVMRAEDDVSSSSSLPLSPSSFSVDKPLFSNDGSPTIGPLAATIDTVKHVTTEILKRSTGGSKRRASTTVSNPIQQQQQQRNNNSRSVPLVQEQLIVLTVPTLGTMQGISITSTSIFVLNTTAMLKTSTTIYKFLGIPYAVPPVGQKRWSRPTLLTKLYPSSPQIHDDETSPFVLDATSFGASCYASSAETWIKPEAKYSEDCLFLNVFIPSHTTETVMVVKNSAYEEATSSSSSTHDTFPSRGTFPVVAFLHGGGFVLGSGANPSTAPDPTLFVLQNKVIFVTLNYRLGALGFLVSPAMEGKDDDEEQRGKEGMHKQHSQKKLNNGGGGGLFGVLDQEVALHWIQRYIEAFGGDKTSVILQSESAGAVSACFHIVIAAKRQQMSKKLRAARYPKLFSKAILESGLCSFPFQTIAEAAATKDRLVEATGCTYQLAQDEQLAEHNLPTRRSRASFGEQGHVTTQKTQSHPNMTASLGRNQPKTFLQGADYCHHDDDDESKTAAISSITSIGGNRMCLANKQPQQEEQQQQQQQQQRQQQHTTRGIGASTLFATQDIFSQFLLENQELNVFSSTMDSSSPTSPSSDEISGVSSSFIPILLISRIKTWFTEIVQSLQQVFSLQTYSMQEQQQAPLPPPPSSASQESTLSFQTKKDEYELACLRSLDAEAVQHALNIRRGFMFFQGESFFPVINGYDIETHPLRVLQEIQQQKEEDDEKPLENQKSTDAFNDDDDDLEIIWGHNADEASVFLLFGYPVLLTQSLVRDFLQNIVGETHMEAIWNQYMVMTDDSIDPKLAAQSDERNIKLVTYKPSASSATTMNTSESENVPPFQPEAQTKIYKYYTRDTLKGFPLSASSSSAAAASTSMSSMFLRQRTAAMLSDMWLCASHHYATVLSQTPGMKHIRMYQFQHTPSYLSPLLSWLGAFHGSELDFVFGTHDGHVPTREEAHLAQRIMTLWGEFIHDGGNHSTKTITSTTDASTSAFHHEYETNEFSNYYFIQNAQRQPTFPLKAWSYYKNTTQMSLILTTPVLLIESNSRPLTCAGIWDTGTTDGEGILRFPPQSSEPVLSRLSNQFLPLVMTLGVQYVSQCTAVVQEVHKIILSLARNGISFEKGLEMTITFRQFFLVCICLVAGGGVVVVVLMLFVKCLLRLRGMCA